MNPHLFNLGREKENEIMWEAMWMILIENSEKILEVNVLPTGRHGCQCNSLTVVMDARVSLYEFLSLYWMNLSKALKEMMWSLISPRIYM